MSLLAVDFEFDGLIDPAKQYLFVSLGCNCWQAQALRPKAHSLRDAAFPFDWLVSLDTAGLIKCLDERFNHFLDESCFVRSPGKQLDLYFKLTLREIDLENTYYNFVFTHDWPYSGEQVNEIRDKGQLKFIGDKYSRRIARFDQLREYKGKVFFIRCFQLNPHFKGEYGWNAQQALQLKEALTRFFPKLDFTLVVVSCTDSAVSEIGNIDGIKEYKIKDLTVDNFSEYEYMYSDLLADFMAHYNENL